MQENTKLKISTVKEEMILWHSIFGPFDIKNVQKLVVEDDIQSKNPAVATCTVPCCRSCIVGMGNV